MKKIAKLALVLILFSACEDRIKINKTQKEPKLVIDGFLNNKIAEQEIIVKFSASYFDKIGSEQPITNATVFVLDSNNGILKIRPFVHTTNGKYTWTPTPSFGDTFELNGQYALVVIRNKDTFISLTVMHPTANFKKLDIITEPKTQNAPGGKFVEIDANDLIEENNTYWIKTFRNDSFRKSGGGGGGLSLAYDAAFSPNPLTNGEKFIFPLRYGNVNDFQRPYRDGIDNVRVEIHGIANETYLFFNIVSSEGGNGGLFATPPSQIPTNIFALNKNPSIKPAGWFSVASVVSKSIQF